MLLSKRVRGSRSSRGKKKTEKRRVFTKAQFDAVLKLFKANEDNFRDVRFRREKDAACRRTRLIRQALKGLGKRKTMNIGELPDETVIAMDDGLTEIYRPA